ncbi:MAG: hypothetical protein ABR591_14090 [Candidatus Velthaea sp.]
MMLFAVGCTPNTSSTLPTQSKTRANQATAQAAAVTEAAPATFFVYPSVLIGGQPFLTTAQARVSVNSASNVTLAAPTPLTPSADSSFAPGSTVAFDWNDVAGAADYTIQISTTDKFTAFVVNQTVTASAFSASTLPRSTLFWRVNARSGSGVAGPWSATQRFQLK